MTSRTHDAHPGEATHLRRIISRARKRRRSTASSPPSLGERMADLVAGTVGSWRFVIVQSAVLLAWLTGNAIAGGNAWDPFPFILLNLLLSFQAAYTAPIIMMSQNRQADVDRDRAVADYAVNLRAESEIALLHEKIDLLREQQLAEMTDLLRRALDRIEQLEERRA